MQVCVYLAACYVVVSTFIQSYLFTDGQKIARRLSAQITKESHRVKQLFEQYNAMCAGDGVGSCRVSLASVLDPQDVFWHAHADLPGQSNSPIPLALRQELIRFHLQMKRSCEEIELLKQEMHNTIQYLSTKMKSIQQRVEALMMQGVTHYVKGAISILNKQRLQTEQDLKRTVSLCTDIIPISAQVHELLRAKTVADQSDSESDDELYLDFDEPDDETDEDIYY